MDYQRFTRQIKEDSFKMASLPENVRNKALAEIMSSLLESKNSILEANEKDLDAAIKKACLIQLLKG